MFSAAPRTTQSCPTKMSDSASTAARSIGESARKTGVGTKREWVRVATIDNRDVARDRVELRRAGRGIGCLTDCVRGRRLVKLDRCHLDVLDDLPRWAVMAEEDGGWNERAAERWAVTD